MKEAAGGSGKASLRRHHCARDQKDRKVLLPLPPGNCHKPHRLLLRSTGSSWFCGKPARSGIPEPGPSPWHFSVWAEVHTHTYSDTCSHMRSHMLTHTHSHACTHTHICSYARTHARSPTYTNTHSHTHAHTISRTHPHSHMCSLTHPHPHQLGGPHSYTMIHA